MTERTITIPPDVLEQSPTHLLITIPRSNGPDESHLLELLPSNGTIDLDEPYLLYVAADLNVSLFF